MTRHGSVLFRVGFVFDDTIPAGIRHCRSFLCEAVLCHPPCGKAAVENRK